MATAEQQLLEQTLSGSLQVLTEVLRLVNPAAFSHAERARRYIHHIVSSMKLGDPWQYEVAAMLSQLGCVRLAPETIEAAYRGETLSPNEQAQYDAYPSVAYALLSKIPGLEPIAWVIEQQNRPVGTIPRRPGRVRSVPASDLVQPGRALLPLHERSLRALRRLDGK